MRSPLPLTVCICVVLIAGGTPEGQSADQRGREALGRAAAAARVDGPIPRLWLVEGTGRENLTGELQGLVADEPTWRPHEERVAVDFEEQSVAWERRTPRNDESLRHRRFVYAPSTTIVVDHANQFTRTIEGDVPAERRRALMRRIPHLLLADIASRSASDVRWLREVRVDGARADEIAVTLPADGTITLTVGREPAVLLRAAYDLHFPGRGDTTVVWHWGGWTPHDTLGWVPAGHRMVIGSVPFQEVTYSRYATGLAEASAIINPPARPAAAQAAAPEWAREVAPATGEIATGVHVARVSGFTVMFVEQPDGVVAFEAPEPFFGTDSIPASGRAAAGTITPRIIEQIKKTIPGKRITHAVISHHHGDHMGGIRAFAAEGATIVMSARDAAAARAAVAAPHAILGDRVPAAPRVMAVDTDIRIGTGANAVDVINVGANPHTDASLVMWVPGAGVMIQGDLFYFNAGSGFHAGRARMNRFFAEWLRTRGLAPRLLYGVHNQGAAGPGAIAEALR